jgi:hypothetical protein
LAALKAALRACTDKEYREIVRELDAERYPPIAGGSGGVPAAYYWGALGDFIERENPYLPLGTGTVPIGGRILRGGLLEKFSAASGVIYTYNEDTVINPPPTTEAGWEAAVRLGYRLPKPTEPGSKTWFHKVGVKPKDTPELPGTHLPDTRQVVKTVEIEYQPDVDGGTGLKPPHIIILFCGGNSA